MSTVDDRFAPLVPFAESFMTAQCTITDDPGGAEDDSLDQTTGLLTPVDPAEPVYTGQCSVKDFGSKDVEKAGQWEVAIPISASPVPAPQQKITITASDADPSLVGRVLRIVSVSAGTLQVQRKMLCVGW